MESQSTKVINAIISNEEPFTHLEEFVKLCQSHYNGETEDDIVLQYLKKSGGCQEITNLLKELYKSNAKEAEVLLNSVSHILMRIASDLKLYESVAISLSSDVLNYATKTVFNFFRIKPKPSRVKTCLKLLTSVAIQSPRMAQNVFMKLSINMDSFPSLLARSNPVEAEDVRAFVIHLIVALLTIGNNTLIRQVVELKGFLNPVFPGLQHDRAPIICIILTTLKSEVLENTAVSKTSKINLFNDFTMKSVLDLYSWRGPKRMKKTLKRKLGEDDQTQVIEAREEDIALVRKTAHDFMLALCCSHKSGIIFRDASYGTSGKNSNHVITNILSSFPSPYSNVYMSELVVSTLKVCPDVSKFYLPTLKNSLVPRCTYAWINAIKLLKQVVSAQDPCTCFVAGEKRSVPKLLTMVKTVCIPEVVTSSQIIQSLKDFPFLDLRIIWYYAHVIKNEGFDHCVCYHLLDYFSCILKQVKQIVDFCKSGQIAQYTAIELTSFHQSFVNNFMATFPVANHLWNYWVHITKEGFNTSDENAVDIGIELPALTYVLSKILEVLMLLKEISPTSLNDVDMNLPDMMSGIEKQKSNVSPDELCSLQIQVIELIASQGKVENIFLEKIGEDEYKTSFSIILDLYLSAGNPNVLKSVSDLIHQLLQKTKIFEFGEWEIDLWLCGLKGVKKRYQIHVVKFLSSVLLALLAEPNKYTDEILTCTMEYNSKSNVANSVVQMLGEFLSNESTMEGEMFQDLLNMLHREHCFSSMVPAALSCLQSLSGSEKKACRQYIEFVLRHVLHRQHSPEIFFILIQKHEDLFHCNHFNYWKLLYCLKTKEKIDGVEFVEENEDLGKTLSEKLQSNFILKFVHQNLGNSEKDELRSCSEINDLSTEDTLHITWQILMYIEMCTSTITENSGLHLQVSQYLNLLNELIMKALNDSKESERHSVENIPYETKIKKSSVLSSVIIDILSHPALLDFFLKTDLNPDCGNFTALKKCSNAISKFILEVITCALNHQNIIDVQHYLLPFKEKMMKCFASHVIPAASSGKKLIVKSSLLVDIFQISTSLFNAKDVTVLLEQILELEIMALLKLDPELQIISSLLKIHVEEKETSALPGEVVKSLCGIYSSALDEKLRKCIGNLVRIVLQRHSSYAHAVSKEICLSLLDRQVPEDLEVLFILISNSQNHLEVIQEVIMSSVENWDNWNPVFILSLTAKYFCMDTTNSSSSLSFFQQCISSPFWSTLSHLLKHETNDLSDNVTCDIGKTVSLLVINKHLELKKIKNIMKAVEKSATHPSPAKMNIVLQILKNITSNSVASEIPSCSFAVKTLMNWSMEMTKNLEEPVQIKLLNDCVLVLKNMDASSVEHAVSDKELWTEYLMKIIKVALKTEHIGPQLLELIRSFCEKVHISDNDNSTLISASHIYELITGHSNFFRVLLDESKDYHCLKESIVDVLILLVQMDNTVCKEGHVSLFLAAYGATLSSTDQKLLFLLLLYEKNGINMSNFSPFLWGKTAIAHYSVQKDTRLFLWKQPKMEEVVGNFVPENVLLTSLNFPLDLSLEPAYPPSEFTIVDASCECDLHSIYDPRFVLPLISVLLSPGSYVHCITFLESKVLGVIFTSLSSSDPNTRAVGYYCLSQFYEHLQISTFSEKLVWIALLDSIKNAITSPNRRLPSMITVFLAKAVDVLMKPDHPLHVPLYRFLMVKPTLDLGNVPEFYTLFGSTDIEYRVQRSWILTLLADGLKSSLDFHLCSKRYVFSILLPYFNSTICVPQEKVKILKIISAAVSIYSSARTLCQGGLLPWLHNAIVQSDEEDYPFFKYFVYIIKNLWYQETKSTERKTFYSSFASELLLVELSMLKHLKALDSATMQCYLETLHSTLMHVKTTTANVENQDECLDLSSVSLMKIIEQHQKNQMLDDKFSAEQSVVQ